MLGSYLGRHVEIAALEVRVGGTFAVELTGVRVFSGREPLGEPIVQVPRALGRQPWLRVMAGQVVPSSWQIERPLIRIQLGAEDGMGSKMSLPALPPLDLYVRDGSLVLERPGAPALSATNVTLRTTRSGLPTHARGSAGGRLWVGTDALASFDVAIDVRAGQTTVEGDLDELDLATLPLPPSLRLRGRGSGHVRLLAKGDRIEADMDLRFEGLEVEHDALTGVVAPSRARATVAIAWDGETLALRAKPVRLDDLVLTGDLSIPAPGPGRVRASLDVGDFEPGLPALGRVHVLALMGQRFETWERFNRRIEGGRIEGMHIELDLPLGDLERSLTFRRKLAPEEFTISLRARDGVFRNSPDSAPFENISADIALEGNRLEMLDVRMTRSGRPLATVDVTIDGMHRLVHLPAEERQLPAGPGTGIPGLGAAMRALRTGETGGDPPVLHLSNFQIGYTAFLLPIRNATGDLRFPEGRVEIENAKAVIGGAPGRLSAVYDPGADTVWVHVRYEDGEAPPRVDPAPAWASGSFFLATLPMGRWRLDQVEGELRATGARVEVPEFEALFSNGPTHGSGEIDLGSADGADFNFVVHVSDADASGLEVPLERAPGTIRGRLALDGRLAGRLGPDLDFIEECDFGLAARIENGSFGDLPALVVLARLPSLAGIRGLFGSQLPFDVVSGDIELRGGVLYTQNFALQGPELRAHARGQMDLGSEDLDSDFQLAFLFLQTVDRVIGTVPILGRWMLGEDQSLVAITLQVDGPWADPRVRVLAPGPVQTAAGWAARVVTSGANQLLRVLGVDSNPPREEPKENGTSPEQGP